MEGKGRNAQVPKKGRKAQVKGCVEKPSSASATTGRKAQVSKKGRKAQVKDCVERPGSASATTRGKRPCEDHPNSASATDGATASVPKKGRKAQVKGCVEKPSSAAAGKKAQVPKKGGEAQLKIWDELMSETAGTNPNWRDSIEIPPETVAAYEELRALGSATRYPDVYAYHLHPDRYGFFVEGGRTVYKLKVYGGGLDLFETNHP